MSNIFYLASAPEYFGSDVTADQAETIAFAIANAVDDQFDGIDCQPRANGGDNSESDPDGEIQKWVNDNWADIAAGVL